MSKHLLLVPLLFWLVILSFRETGSLSNIESVGKFTNLLLVFLNF